MNSLHPSRMELSVTADSSTPICAPYKGKGGGCRNWRAGGRPEHGSGGGWIPQVGEQRWQVARCVEQAKDPRRVGPVRVDQHIPVARNRPEPIAWASQRRPMQPGRRIGSEQLHGFMDSGPQSAAGYCVIQVANGVPKLGLRLGRQDGRRGHAPMRSSSSIGLSKPRQTYPPGDGRLAALNQPIDPNGACTNAVKNGSGCSGGDHHRR